MSEIKVLKSCNECPAITWTGEDGTGSDVNKFFCAFNAFYGRSREECEQIPTSCPIRNEQNAALKAKCETLQGLVKNAVDAMKSYRAYLEARGIDTDDEEKWLKDAEKETT